jgi:hypothetical protein
MALQEVHIAGREADDAVGSHGGRSVISRVLQSARHWLTLPAAVNSIIVFIFFASYVAAVDIAPAKPTSFSSAVPFVFDWSGFYLGGHVAFGAGRGTSGLSDAVPTSVGGAFSSLFGGIQGGYNYGSSGNRVGDFGGS